MARLSTKTHIFDRSCNNEVIFSAKEKGIIPSVDELCKQAGKEFTALRKSHMSKRDLVHYMQLKERKSEASQILHFWEGVNTCLQSTNKHKIFSELKYFRKFTKFAHKSQLKQAKDQVRSLTAQQNAKENLSTYHTQVGKLKAYSLMISYMSDRGDEKGF